MTVDSIRVHFPECLTTCCSLTAHSVAPWPHKYNTHIYIHLCLHIHIYTNAGSLGIQKLRTVIRDRAGVSKINTLLASCKQTSAFPSELPRMRLWEHKWRAKNSLFIPTSRSNQEQAQSQNYRSDIWISDLSPRSAPGIGLMSSIVWDINMAFAFSTNTTVVALEKRKCGCHGNWKVLADVLLKMDKPTLLLTTLGKQIIRSPIEYGLRVVMHLCCAYFHWKLEVDLVVTYSTQTSEGNSCSRQSSSVWEK